MKTESNLEDLGYNMKLEAFRIEQKLDDFEIGRVIAEHRERYIVRTANAEFEAEITGNMRFSASSREDFPAVGDWVALTTYDSNFAIIHKIFPRSTVITRQAVGQSGELQVIAANIDYAFLVQSADRDFNINRLERYLTICNAAKVSPVIILSKTDLIREQKLSEIHESIKMRIKDLPLVAVSNETKTGYDKIKTLIERGKTYCMLGSSGVGKSTLINNLSGVNIMKTDAISRSTNKGRHVTTHRELIVLENGGILIDNPGMREVGIAGFAGGLEATFDVIIDLSKQCKFKDCTHISESGCAVIQALNKGKLEQHAYENYLRLMREEAHFESTVEERHRKEKKFGKMLKNYKKDKDKGFL